MFRNSVFTLSALFILFLSVSCSLDRSKPLSVDLDEPQVELTPSNLPPVIAELSYGLGPGNSMTVEEIGGLALGQQVRIWCRATDPENERITLTWSASNGKILYRWGRSEIYWQAPESPGPATIFVEVSDSINTTVDSLCFITEKIGPRLTFLGSASLGFGYVPRRATVTHSFQLWSTGDDTLKIFDDDCPCDLLVSPTKQIPPQRSAAAVMSILTETFRDETNKTLNIATNDPTTALEFDVSMNVVLGGDSTYPLVIKPWIQDLTRPDGVYGYSDFVRFSLTNVSDEDVRIWLRAVPSDVSVQLQNSEIPANGSTEGLILLRQDLWDNAFNSSVTFQVNDENQTRYTIPVVRKAH